MRCKYLSSQLGLFILEAGISTPFSTNFFLLFGVLRCFQHCTGHITSGSWKGRGNQYIQLVRVLYCKLPTNGKQLPAFPLEAVPGTEPRPQTWEARVLPLCPRGPRCLLRSLFHSNYSSEQVVIFLAVRVMVKTKKTAHFVCENIYQIE